MDLGNIKYNMKSNINYNITGLVFDLVQRLDMIFTIDTPSNSMQCDLIQRVNNFREHYISAKLQKNLVHTKILNFSCWFNRHLECQNLTIIKEVKVPECPPPHLQLLSSTKSKSSGRHGAISTKWYFQQPFFHLFLQNQPKNFFITWFHWENVK